MIAWKTTRTLHSLNNSFTNKSRLSAPPKDASTSNTATLGCEMLDQQTRYADDITSMLIGNGLIQDEEAEEFKTFIRGW